jgi:succinate dehydrogenase/fumarate reductase flavoprotein subunit
MGGAAIGQECETTVPGLFAVGEVAGGVHGANRMSGCALTEVFVFGDLLGQSVKSWIGKEVLIVPIKSEIQESIDKIREIFSRTRSGVRPCEIKQAIRNIFWDNFGPSRDETGMQKGLAELEKLRTELGNLAIEDRSLIYNREKMEAIEVSMMIKTGILVANAALTRKESRGAHYRVDFPSRDDAHWLKNIVLSKDPGGEVKISYRQAGVGR